MKIGTLSILAPTIFLFVVLPTTLRGASTVDQETKNAVITLQNQLDQLAVAKKQDHDEWVRFFSENREERTEMIQLLSQENPDSKKGREEIISLLKGLSGQISILMSRPPPPANLVPPPPASIVVSPPSVSVSIPEELKIRLRNTDQLNKLAIGISVLCLLLTLILLVTLRNRMQVLQKVLFHQEEAPVPETPRGRPYLSVQSDGRHIHLVNEGGNTADEIRLYAGSAPRTMKQKVKTSLRLDAGHQEMIAIPPLPEGDALYMNLEYKNPYSGRWYKDQFVMRIDPQSGRLHAVPNPPHKKDLEALWRIRKKSDTL